MNIVVLGSGGKGILCSATLTLLLDWRIALVCWSLFAVLWLTTLCVARLGERGGGLPGHDAPCVRRRVCDRIFRSDRGARALCAP